MRKYTRVFEVEEPIIEVCPYQYTRCDKPAGAVCKIAQVLLKIEDAQPWRLKADRAIECQYRGDKLTLSQHEHHRLGKL